MPSVPSASDVVRLEPDGGRSENVENIYPRLMWKIFRRLGYPIRDGAPIAMDHDGIIQEIGYGDICQLTTEGNSSIRRLCSYLEHEQGLDQIPRLVDDDPSIRTHITRPQQCLSSGYHYVSAKEKRSSELRCELRVLLSIRRRIRLIHY
jgi:hypothetical protein